MIMNKQRTQVKVPVNPARSTTNLHKILCVLPTTVLPIANNNKCFWRQPESATKKIIQKTRRNGFKLHFQSSVWILLLKSTCIFSINTRRTNRQSTTTNLNPKKESSEKSTPAASDGAATAGVRIRLSAWPAVVVRSTAARARNVVPSQSAIADVASSR